MRVLIVGCGYVGTPLGAELAKEGHAVVGIRRSSAAAAELTGTGIKLVVADITKPGALVRLPGPFDWVVNTVSTQSGGAAEYRAVFLNGTRNLIEWLQAAMPLKFVYTSSSGVYGQTDGSAVTEESPAEPETETSQILVETEELLLEAARSGNLPAVILRVAGIYGPDRGHWFRLFLVNQARIEGTGCRLLNMIHRDDVVGAIMAALRHGRIGEIYNAVDDEPVTQLNFFRWLSKSLRRPLPPFCPAAEKAGPKRGSTNKRVLNRKLKTELGYQLLYPSFREGYLTEIQRLDPRICRAPLRLGLRV